MIADEDIRRELREVKRRLEKLETCDHEYEIVGGRNSNYRYYYSGAFAYIKCVKCGQRKQA